MYLYSALSLSEPPTPCVCVHQVAEQTNQDLLVLVNETTKDFELNPLLLTLICELTSHHIPTRMAALRWINMLLEKAPQVREQHGDAPLPFAFARCAPLTAFYFPTCHCRK